MTTTLTLTPPSSPPCPCPQVKSVATVPVIANGDVFSLSALSSIHAHTGVDGFMSARGILANPALFTSPTLPPSAPYHYLQLAEQYGGRFVRHHHHLMFMLGSGMTRAERMEFAGLRSLVAIRDFFTDRQWITAPGTDEAEAAALQAEAEREDAG